MKVVKPLRLGFSFRTFEHRSQHHLVVTLLAAFPFDEPDALLAEVDMWTALSDELGRFGMFDQGMWKEQGEAIVIGYAHPPNPPAPSCEVGLSFREVEKRLYVFGDRRWAATGPTDPEPFDRMPLTYERAFGGPSHRPNPHGRGAEPVTSDRGEQIHPLPNVEHPKHLIGSQRDKPPPASFAAEDFTLHGRFEKMGTYDASWRENRFPGLADDIDWSVFNLAPADQRMAGFFDGTERFSMKNLHPERRELETGLPRVTGRVLLARGQPDELESLPTRLDTVVLVPHALMGICLFRAVTPIASFDAHEVTHCVAALEPRDGPARPLEHYVEALAMRLDRDKAHIYLLRDRDFLPDFVPAPPRGGTERDPYTEAVELEGLMNANQQRRLDRELERVKEQMAEAGLDTSELDEMARPKLEVPESFDDLPDFMEQLEAEQAQIDEQHAEAKKQLEAQLRERGEELGLDAEELERMLEEGPGGPPELRAEAEVRRLSELCEAMRKAGQPMVALEEQLADPGYRDKLQQMEDQLFHLYLLTAHHQGPAQPPSGEDAALSRQRALIAIDAGEPLHRVDLTGVDLSGAELAGADLRGALLERANLEGANLEGADLTEAVLTRANLAGAKMARAKLAHANLGKADLRQSDLSGAVLDETVVDQADLTGARLDGASISLALVGRVTLDGASLAGVIGHRVFFHHTDLRGTSWQGAKLEECAFIEANLEDVDMSTITLRSCTLVTAKADRLRLTGGDLGNLRMVKDTSMRQGDLRDSTLDGANFRGCDLTRACLSGARATGCDFGDAVLERADLRGAILSGSYFIRSVLSEAVLDNSKLDRCLFHHAHLSGTSFRGANLFSADLTRAVGDDRTSFSDCIVTRVIGAP